jgi:Ni,Fe-hydrogenase III large subunit
VTMRALVDGVVAIAEIPVAEPEAFTAAVVDACRTGGRLLALPVVDDQGANLVAVVAVDGNHTLQALRLRVPADRRYPSLTARLPQAHAFERAVAEAHGLVPEGHPWPKPLRRHADLETPGAPDAHPFFRMAGAGVHEVAVGPVHAGIIEPGHFRFQCYGETVHHLEIQLGYQHRGSARLIQTAAPARRLAVAEAIAGDSTLGHGLAHVIALEKLAGTAPPADAERLRAFALEVERMASHTGDLGALCGDVGYQPGAAWFGRLRGDFLNLLLELTGNRFGRGLLRPGGVRFGLSGQERAALVARCAAATADFERIADVMFDSPAVASRCEGTGQLTATVAAELGLVGPAARACGLDRDARRDHPEGAYRDLAPPVATREAGDVLARAEVRRLEAGHAAAYAEAQLAAITGGPLAHPLAYPLPPARLAVAIVEGWRGEIVHVASTDNGGELAAYDVVDPSLHNWFGLAMAMRGNAISDFPLCNKSFNLSYAGHDL